MESKSSIKNLCFTDNLKGCQKIAFIVSLILPFCADAAYAIWPLRSEWDERIKYCTWQLEKVSRFHFQGYVQLVRDYRFSCVQSLFTRNVHIERQRARKNAEARDYCHKSESAVHGSIFEFGEFSEGFQGKRTDLYRCIKDMQENGLVSANKHWPETYVKYHKGLEKSLDLSKKDSIPKWRDIKVVILWGDPGTGKSRHVWKQDGVYKLNYDHHKCWFDGYNYEPILLIDEFYGNLQYGKLMDILDGHPFQAEVKGGFKMAAWTKVYIVSNVNPHKWYENHWRRYPLSFNAFKRRVSKIKFYCFGNKPNKWNWIGS